MRILLFTLIIIPSLLFSQIVVSNDDTHPTLVAETFHLNGTLKIRKKFDYEEYSKSGDYIVISYEEYYDNGKVRLKTKIDDLKPDGELLAYWKNGNLKRKDLYKNGILLEGKTWDINGNEEEYSKFEMPSQVKEN